MIIRADGIGTRFNKIFINKDVSFAGEAGEIIGILGETGSGKTTLLKAICQIIPYDGTVEIEGTNLKKLSNRELSRLISYIPQKNGISLDISALDVVLMGFNNRLTVLEKPNSAMVSEALRALESVGMKDFAEHNFCQLSEGQKQLVIFARALVSEAKLMVLDEPESALDVNKRSALMMFIRDWVGAEKCAVTVLHDPGLALNYCDKLILIKNAGVSGIIRPKNDTIEDMERALEAIYGGVTLARVADKAGREQLVMLKE